MDSKSSGFTSVSVRFRPPHQRQLIDISAKDEVSILLFMGPFILMFAPATIHFHTFPLQ